MGTSPKEQASADQYKNMQGIGQNFLSGNWANQSFSQINPYFNQARTDINAGVGGAETMLNQSLSTRLAGIGQNTGESLISSGIAPGQGRTEGMGAAMAPAIAANQQSLAGLEQWKTGTLAQISQNQGGSLMDLLKTGGQFGMGAENNATQAIGGMKDSTTMGDIMGGLTTGALMAAIATNPELLSLLGLGKGAVGMTGGSGPEGGVNPTGLMWGMGG